MLPVFAVMKHPFAVSLLIGCVSNFVDEGTNFMPIFSFLPFFIAGHFTEEKTFHDRRSPWIQAAFLSTMLFFALIRYILICGALWTPRCHLPCHVTVL